MGVCFRAGVFGIESPRRLVRIVRAIEHHGLLASSIAIGAIRHPDRVAVRDERGDLSYRELYEHANALANAWRERGLRAGDGVAILVRNHRGFLRGRVRGDSVRRPRDPAQHFVRRTAAA